MEFLRIFCEIPPKTNHQAKVDGERPTIVILGELTLEQELYYGRAIMTTNLGSVDGLDLICSKAAAKATWQFIKGSNADHGDESTIITTMWALHYGDKSIVLNMRTMNGKSKDEAFDLFFLRR